MRRVRLATMLLLGALAPLAARAPLGPATTGGGHAVPVAGIAPPPPAKPGSVKDQPNAPSTEAPEKSQTSKAAPWPPAPGTGDYYGNAFPGWYGGKPYDDLPLAGRQPDEAQNLFRPTRGQQRLTFSGFADFGMTLRSVTGAKQTFAQDQYGKDKLFTENASLLVTGPLWKWLGLNVHAQVEQRSFGFNDTKPVWRIYWEDQNNRVTFGDITPQVGDTNEFVPFSRRLTGLEATGRIGSKVEYMAFGSQVGGSIRSETFVGDGTPGPYYLTYVPIVDGSAVVVLDGVVQQAGYGDTGDYTLNPSTGELTFNGARIIPPTSRIEVRYETLSHSGPQDLLLGGELRLTPFRNWRLGMQYITQLSGSGGISNTTEQRVTDQITVPTPSNGPFTIRPRPIVVGSESVQVNGILQQRDQDYQISYETGELRFFQIQPEGANITVRFSVIQTADLGSGDRGIFGLDTSYSFGRHLNLQLEFAQSSGTPSTGSNPFSFSGSGLGYGYSGYSYGSYSYGNNTGSGYGVFGNTGSGTGLGSYNGGGYSSGYNNGGLGGYNGGGFSSGVFNGGASSFRAHTTRQTTTDTNTNTGTQAPSGKGGSAYKIAFNSRFGGFQLAGQYKAVGDNFSRIDSTGFFQNEKGLSLQAQYSTGQRFSMSYQLDHYSRPYTTTDSTTDTTSTNRVGSDLNLASLTWRFTPDSLLNFLWNDQSNSGGGSSTTLSRQSLSLSHRFSSQFQFSAGLDRARSGSSGLSSLTGQSLSNLSNSLSGRAGASYQTSGGRFGVHLDYSFSGTNSATSKNSATSILGSLNWQPFKILTLQASHQLTNSRNESLVGRVWVTPPKPGTIDWLLYRHALEASRQTGVGAFDGSTTGGSTIPTDPLTGGNLTGNTISDNNTQNTSLSVLLAPTSKLSLTTSFTHSVTDNGRLAGSTSDSLQTNLHYQVSNAIGLGAGYSNQSLRYTDTGDQTHTGIINFNLDWRLSNHLDARFDYQSLGTHNVAGTGTGTGTGTGSTTTTNPDTSYGSWGLDMRYQLPGHAGHSLFASLRSDSNSGGANQSFSRLEFQSGMDFRLTSVVGLRLSYDMTSYSSKGTTDNSYLANLFNASVGARF